MADGIDIQRTRNLALIHSLSTDPSIFPHITDDYHPNSDQWTPSDNENVIYLVGTDLHGPFGFAVFIPQTWACWQAHIGFLPRSYGGPALQAFREMLGWMWANTKAARIVGEICVENRRAIAFVERAGFERYGLNPKSILRGGELRDQVCLGISKA